MFGKVTIVWLHPFNTFNCLSWTNFHLLLCSRVTQRTTFKGRRFSICFLRSGGWMNMGQIDWFLLAVVKYPVFKGRFWTYVPNRFNVGALSQAITTRQFPEPSLALLPPIPNNAPAQESEVVSLMMFTSWFSGSYHIKSYPRFDWTWKTRLISRATHILTEQLLAGSHPWSTV